MAAKHTPGPWTVREEADRSTVEIVCARGILVCEVGDCSKEDQANAHLIAAAPDMFKTLSDMDGWLANTGHAEDHPWRLSLRAAIAKATGSAT